MRTRPLPKLQSDVASGKVTLTDAVTGIADAGRLEDLAKLLAARTSIPDATALRLLESTDETGAALLCRAASLSVNAYSAILRLRRRLVNGAPDGPAALLSAYIALCTLEPKGIAAQLQALVREPASAD